MVGHAGLSGTHSVCVCTTHQNTILLVDALNWEVTYKELVTKVVCDPSNGKCMMHRCNNCPGTNALRKLLEQEFVKRSVATPRSTQPFILPRSIK